MKAVVYTTRQGVKKMSLSIHQNATGALLLDYYPDAYSAKLVNLKDACEEVGIDFAKLVNKKADEAKLEVNAMQELYGEGDELEAAKDKYYLFCAMV